MDILLRGGVHLLEQAALDILSRLLPFRRGRAACLLLTAGWEAVTKKKLDPKYEGWLDTAGMIFLLGLMALITFKDIFNIFKG